MKTVMIKKRENPSMGTERYDITKVEGLLTILNEEARRLKEVNEVIRLGTNEEGKK